MTGLIEKPLSFLIFDRQNSNCTFASEESEVLAFHSSTELWAGLKHLYNCLVISLTTCPKALLKEFNSPKNEANNLTGITPAELTFSSNKKNFSSFASRISNYMLTELTVKPRKILCKAMGWCLEALRIQPHFISTEIKNFLFLVARAIGCWHVKKSSM